MAKGKQEKQDELVQKFMDAPIVETKETKVEEFTDKVVLSNKRTFTLKPTKLKYFKSGDYNAWKVIKNIGVANILGYGDGFDIICKFLSAVFDKPYRVDQVKGENEEYSEVVVYDEFITNLVDDEMTTKDMANIINVSLKVNEIDVENF